MRVGYVRVSSTDQNTVRQLDGIDIERVFVDRVSGKDTARPKLAELLAFVRDGDTVLVHSMDRLARNLDDLRRVPPPGRGNPNWPESSGSAGRPCTPTCAPHLHNKPPPGEPGAQLTDPVTGDPATGLTTAIMARSGP